MISRFTIDRMTIAALAIAATLPFLAISPAQAAPVNCAQQVQSIEASAAANASAVDQKAIQRALRTARVAAKICEEGNGHEAARKFKLAQAQLGGTVQLAQQR